MSLPFMQFLCLAYEEEALFREMPRDEWLEMREETLRYVDELRSRGVLIDARPLQSARTAAAVRIREGQTHVTDGPFAETKEQLGGFFLIDVPDREEALRIAAGWPSSRVGTIEVRPLEEGLPTDSRY